MSTQAGTNNTAQILDTMLKQDAYSRWLGIEIDEYREGYCRLHFTIRPEMLNGFNIVHGGIIFSASDSAFAFACNSHGIISVALDVHITFVRAGKVGDIMTIEAKEIHTGNKTSFYDITTTNASNEIVATFKGTAYRTGKPVVSEQV